MTDNSNFDLQELKPERLRQNFQQCLRQLQLDPATVEKPPENAEALFLPTTHTFGAFKSWDNPQGQPQVRETWKNILVDDKALLSDARRSESRKILPGEPRRGMPVARQLTLDHFVFAYLGIHDPYYARQGVIRQPPFGIFIATENEKFPRVVTTRRDMGSDEVSSDEIAAAFLLPLDGRQLAYYESIYDPRHNGDFWHYWGSPQCSDGPDFHAKCWSWLVEFHYQDAVPVSTFVAIMWPHEYVVFDGGGRALRPIGQRDTFASENHQCHVIPYVWSRGSDGQDFRQASDDVTRFFAKNRHFPEDIDHAKQSS